MLKALINDQANRLTPMTTENVTNRTVTVGDGMPLLSFAGPAEVFPGGGFAPPAKAGSCTSTDVTRALDA